MAGFFKGLFSRNSGKEEPAASAHTAPLRARSGLAQQAEQDYRTGKDYMLKGDLERARLYLERASTIYSNFDQVYEECKVFMYECDEQIGALEEEELLFNELLDEVTEKSEDLDGRQNYLWGLLTLARFQALFDRLSSCPGCEILGETGRVLDLFSQGLMRPLQPEELEYLQGFIMDFYDFDNSESFVDPANQVPVDGGQPLQVFDLNGNSAFISIHIFMDNCINLFGGMLAEGEGEPAELDFIPCTLMEDYYLRTTEGDIRELPGIQAETARIWSDYEFVKGNPDMQAVVERMEGYRKLDLV